MAALLLLKAALELVFFKELRRARIKLVTAYAKATMEGEDSTIKTLPRASLAIIPVVPMRLNHPR